MRPPIPLILVTGFLGSGKTTLLNRLLERYAEGTRVGIVQNEFAPTPMDGALLRQGGKPFELLEVNNGSVFCDCLMLSFIRSLRAFIDAHDPAMLILEASGLSDPTPVMRLVQHPSLVGRVLLGPIVCVVDAANYHKVNSFADRLGRQVLIADTLVVNKIDLCQDPKGLEQRLRELNPLAQLIWASHCQWAGPIDDALRIGPERPNWQKALPDSPAGRPAVGVGVLRTAQPLGSQHVEAFLNELLADTLRVKGYLRTTQGGLLVQGVMSAYQYAPTQAPVPRTEIIAIGPGVDAKRVSQTYSKFV